jgi:hypothetical protein
MPSDCTHHLGGLTRNISHQQLQVIHWQFYGGPCVLACFAASPSTHQLRPFTRQVQQKRMLEVNRCARFLHHAAAVALWALHVE